ncbi:MFS transporter [Neobacillus sp. OS1-32]|uniref:MFS transporter n=1 Tax=Neobacillus sp. OS1-32 TaxID=3070682 RepID=UPI0027E12D34|nr:MFS transporter [Neobacillus sp. OS1-32]WML30167.1 MFS transporter [Neobacillus sp. OS1-32]
MFKNKNYLRLLLGQTAANLGDIFYIVAIISLVYNTTGSAFYASWIPFVMTFSLFAAGVVTPLVLAKIHINLLLTITQFVKTILLTMVWLIVIMTHHPSIFVLLLFIICISFLDGFANPLKQSMIPQYVAELELMKANSIAESIDQVMQIASWMIGGSLLLWLSAENVILFSVCLYGIAATAFFFLAKIQVEKEENRSLFKQVTEGFQIIFQSKLQRSFLWIDLFESAASAVWVSAILLVYVKEVLGQSSAWWGFINAAFFAGMIGISLLMIRFDAWVQQRMKVVVLGGAILSAGATFIFGYTSVGLIALVCSFFVGVGSQLKGIPLQTLFQKVTPKEQLAIVYAAFHTIYTPVFGISTLVVGFLSEQMGVSSVFFFSAACLLVVCILSKRLLRISHGVETRCSSK